MALYILLRGSPLVHEPWGLHLSLLLGGTIPCSTMHVQNLLQRYPGLFSTHPRHTNRVWHAIEMPPDKW